MGLTKVNTLMFNAKLALTPANTIVAFYIR